MSHVDKVNEFFCGDSFNKKGIYKRLLDFSHSPYSGWSFFKANKIVDVGGIASGVIALMEDIATKILLSPVLLPAIAITSSLALIGAIISGIAHITSLGVAAVMDHVQTQNKEDKLLPSLN
ncbi:hypothetical protein [Legionella cincinnatiensis]|uniref:Uncharacterized protein n=1 Tax=Legionella cincinnatiensis TaxID=28085 RepID=A0A378IJG3_9GAMM|nr:hypothetical protein [Legionella cincinnatiensis]KTC82118.1 hypothetical protein Lcin_3188 [Legionella cincinnatiensis]STX35407.1 Uncharacterised protein [Legionella cincinnatiensis]